MSREVKMFLQKFCIKLPTKLIYMKWKKIFQLIFKRNHIINHFTNFSRWDLASFRQLSFFAFFTHSFPFPITRQNILEFFPLLSSHLWDHNLLPLCTDRAFAQEALIWPKNLKTVYRDL